MARVNLDEDVPKEVADFLRSWGHDVETTDELGRKSANDPAQLAYATSVNRVIITHNRKDFRRLHRQVPLHAGIVQCTRDDTDKASLANRIHILLATAGDLTGRLESVCRSAIL